MIKYFSVFLISLTTILISPVLAMDDREELAHSVPLTWRFLEEGEMVEIIAPAAAPMSDAQAVVAREFVGVRGFKAYIAEGAFNKEEAPYGYYANTHKARAELFIRALQGEALVLWAIRGGFGCQEIVDSLEETSFERPSLPPKALIGFSDVTALHLLFATWRWPSLHGPVVGLGKELFPVTKSGVNKEASLTVVTEILKGNIRELSHTFEVIHPGEGGSELIEGSVLGGNLSIVESHNGTRTALCGAGKFIFLEDTAEDPKRLNRRLLALRRAGVFKGAKAIVFGHMPLTGHEESIEMTKDFVRGFVREFLLPRLNIPVIYSPRFGHGAHNDIMPFGTKAWLTVDGPTAMLRVTVNESAY
ncbi:MAG: LD-carboxypeptidase [Proteobacteria bacterium]|nr:LD-carboxypeptidase [Pseudomonadota bacterium]